ncbi:hypothetical protein KKF34_07405 [Myxococcota bacterium]|nr:hypothetical protein [Myxococcota bacterium]MBU1382880.1 hypothetical protein [Myxococcota bacterium]MBU1496686.1 hypothetical protein [Myxococcota bacterium]
MNNSNNLAAYILYLADLLRGDFPRVLDDAIINSNIAHQNQMTQLLSDPVRAKCFATLIFDMLIRMNRQNNETRV